MLRLILILLAINISACANTQRAQLSSLPLPQKTSGHCCWQSIQSIDITHHQQHIRLQSVLAITEQGVTLVLLNQLGRRLLSIVHRPPTPPIIEQSPHIAKVLPGELLLKAVYFTWWNPNEWDDLNKSDWMISSSNNHRTLKNKNTPIMTAEYFPTTENVITINRPQRIRKIQLEHKQQPLSIILKIEHWQAL